MSNNFSSGAGTGGSFVLGSCAQACGDRLAMPLATTFRVRSWNETVMSTETTALCMNSNNIIVNNIDESATNKLIGKYMQGRVARVENNSDTPTPFCWRGNRYWKHNFGPEVPPWVLLLLHLYLLRRFLKKTYVFGLGSPWRGRIQVASTIWFLLGGLTPHTNFFRNWPSSFEEDTI